MSENCSLFDDSKKFDGVIWKKEAIPTPVYIQKELKKRLNSASKDSNVSMSKILNLSLSYYLDLKGY